MRDQRRQSYLQALDVPALASNPAGREPGDDAPSLLVTTGILDEQPVAEVEEQRDSRVGDNLNIDEVVSPIAEPGHADPRQQTRP